MTSKPLVAGVGMVAFKKPGASDSYLDMGEAAINAALKDAGLEYSDVGQVYAGYVYGDSTCGQAVAYRAGLTGIPIVNVNNNCSTGSSALFLARQAVEYGIVDCALAVGFEEMRPGALGSNFMDRVNPMLRHLEAMMGVQEFSSTAPPASQFFGGAGQEYIEKHGAKPETFAKISVKARAHAAHNPLAIFRDQVTVEQVMASPHLYGPVTRLQSCPPTCGAAAAIIVSPAFAKKHGLANLVEIRAQAMTTDFPAAFEAKSMMQIVGYDMSKEAARQVYEKAGVDPKDIQVAEMHDCFTANELLLYEALALTPEGTAEKFIEDGDNTYGGKVVTNPSGGLLSKGHPLGATGLAQCAECVWQLRGQAEQRQVDGAKLALQHNIGLGGAAVVTLYSRA